MDKKNVEPKLYLGLLILIILVAWTINLFVGLNHANNSSNSLGDSFGMVNSLISGISLILVYYAVRLQMKELSETKIEFQKQNDTLLIQQFENTFFNMTKQLQIIVNEMEILEQNLHTGANESIFGNNYLKVVCNEISIELENPSDLVPHDSFHEIGELFKANKKINFFYEKNYYNEIIESFIDSRYAIVFEKHKHNLAHFFRYFYNILKFVSNSKLIDKELYFSILRSQLSNPQLAIIFYNGISRISNSKSGIPKFRNLVDELNILQNIGVEFLPNFHVAKLFYKKTNFKFIESANKI